MSFWSFALDADSSILARFQQLSDKEKIHFYAKQNDEAKNDLWPAVKADIQRINSEAEARKDLELVNETNRIEGGIYCNQKRYNLAIPLLTGVLNTSKKLELNDSLVILWQIIHSYARIKNLPKVFEYQQIVSKIKQRNPDISPWLINANTSSLYLELGLYEKGIEQIREDFRTVAPKYKDQWYIANHYNNIGVYFNKWKKPDSALVNFSIAKKIVEDLLAKHPENTGDEFFLGLIDGNIGQALMFKGNYEAAIPLLIKDVSTSIIENDKGNAAISLNELGQCYIKLKNYSRAEQCLDSASTLLNRSEELDILLYNKKLKAELHSLQGKKDLALIEFKQYLVLKDSITNTENERQLISQQVAFDVKQKEDQLKEQSKLLEAEYKLSRQRRVERNFLAVSIIGLILLLILIFYYLQLFKKQKNALRNKNAEISLQTQLIEQSLKEKETLLKEVHHRVKNNLQIVSSLLSFQASKTTNQEIQETLSECKQRINSIALTHEFLYKSDNIVLIEMKHYLMSLIQQLNRAYQSEKKEIETSIEIDDIKLGIDTALPIGLIVNELVSNAFKHAFTGSKGLISLRFSTLRPDNFLLEVADNGKGLDQSIIDQKKYSMGLELVDILSGQLKTQLKINNIAGTRFTFEFSHS